MVSEEFELKSRRWWRPNIRSKRLWSESLQRFLKVKIAARVLRTVDKVGGIDEYLLGEKEARIRELGMHGWRLRWRLMQTAAVKERFAAERAKLGLPPKEESSLSSKGTVVSPAEVAAEVAEYDAELDEAELRDEDVEVEEDSSFEEKPFQEQKVKL
jgi:large subunit ribosomal protein L28